MQIQESPFSPQRFPILNALHGTTDKVLNNKKENFFVIAGPCAVETREQIFEIANALTDRGITWLRGGAFKPRTSPLDFQGVGAIGLQWLREAADQYGLKVVTEVMGTEQLEEVALACDMFQVGARNMYNTPLLKALGRQNKPVLLKRGFQATLAELLHAAEYIMGEGNRQVVLCERGIRSFDSITRNVLDLGGASLLKQYSGLQVIVDPSHAAGRKDLVLPLTLAAKAMDLDGAMVEISLTPEKALCDGHQALSLHHLDQLLAVLAATPHAKANTMQNTAANAIANTQERSCQCSAQ